MRLKLILALAVGISASAYGQTMIVGASSGRCLDVPGATQSVSDITDYTCKASENQLFSLEPTGDGYYRVRIPYSSMCFDVSWGDTEPGRALSQYSCKDPRSADSWNQQFSLHPFSDGSVALIARHSSQCIDVADDAWENGHRVTQFPCHFRGNQRFFLISGPFHPGI